MNKNIEKIIDFFEENTDIFNEAIEELDNYNSYLSDERYNLMYELDELLTDKTPTEILNLAFYGYDENYQDGTFNSNREYFKFNGYGNLVSSDYRDYSDWITKETIEEMSLNRYYIDTIDKYEELANLFDRFEDEEEEEKTND